MYSGNHFDELVVDVCRPFGFVCWFATSRTVVHNVRPAMRLHVAREDQCESRKIDNSVIFFHDVAID